MREMIAEEYSIHGNARVRVPVTKRGAKPPPGPSSLRRKKHNLSLKLNLQGLGTSGALMAS